MGFRDEFRELAHELRAIPGRDFEIRPYTASVIIRTWSGGKPGDGTATDAETAIVEGDSQPPKIRFLSDEEKALAGLGATVLEIGPITPDFPGGGTSIATLLGTAAAAGTEVLYKITGPEYPTGVECIREGVESDRTFGYKIRVRPVAD